MLEHLDVLVGVIAVMLGLSLVITILNQLLSSLLGLRGRSLRWGLGMLAQTLNLDGKEKLDAGVLEAVDKVLVHPMVSDSQFPWFHLWQRATAIRYDEFVKMVGILGEPANANPILKKLREENRITSPWFDSAMDRVSQRFGMQMRLLTVVLGLLIAFLLPVDTVDLVNTLRTDQQLRTDLAAAADAVSKLNTLPDSDAELKATAKTLLGPLQSQMGTKSLGDLLSRPREGYAYIVFTNGGVDWKHLGGILLTTGLLSLGAPFWFHTLKGLTSLRSVVANKADADRQRLATPDAGDGIRWTDTPA